VGRSTGSQKLRSLGLALIAVLAISAPVALAAEEPTQAEYVKRLEPICKQNSQANARILRGVKGQVKKGKLVPAGRRFVRASNALGRSVNQMARVPRPAADVRRLKQWFGYLQRERLYLLRIGKALKSKNKFQAQKQAVQLNRNNNRANNVVISFGFKECRIDSSKFL
jgi:ABC-type uncharacterized transport system fused permease/ATPase subunit